MKYVIGTVSAVLAGIVIGFFGVLVSVFTDGTAGERLTAIAVILLIYFFLSAFFAYFLHRYSWVWGLYVGVPAVILLGFYSRTEFNLYYLLYMAAIILISCLGAWVGSRAGRRTRARDADRTESN